MTSYCLLLQTKKGETAKTITAAEFVECMKEIKDKSEKCTHEDEHKKYYKKGGPYYSRDNAPWHAFANLQEVGIEPEDILQLPPNSPDMHKVIEKIINNTWRELHSYLLEHAEVTTAKDVVAAFQKAFANNIKVETVRKLVDGLPKTYRAIQASRMQGGSEGDWPQAKYR